MRSSWLSSSRTRAGWRALHRAQRLLDESGLDRVARGYLCYAAAVCRTLAGDPEQGIMGFDQAAVIGDRFHDPKLGASARVGRGRRLIYLSEVSEEMALLDDAMVAVTAREVSPHAGDRYLDVAAGPDGLSLPAARLGARVLATDWSPAMIDRFDARVRDEGLTDAAARVMDAHAFDIEDDSFDVSVTHADSVADARPGAMPCGPSPRSDDGSDVRWTRSRLHGRGR